MGTLSVSMKVKYDFCLMPQGQPSGVG